MATVSLAEIIKAIIALPTILSFVSQMIAYLKSQFGESWQQYLTDATKAFDQLNKAQTPEEKQNAAKSIQTLISKL